MTRRPPVVRIGAAVLATVKTWNGALSSARRDSGPGTSRVREKTSKGPVKSRISTSSKIRMPAFHFTGPFEVFSRTRLVPGPESHRADDSAPFHVFTVAKTAAPIRTTGGLRVIPHYGFADAPQTDLVVVPGRWGTRVLLPDAQTLDWIRRTAARARQVTSVCTGSLLP